MSVARKQAMKHGNMGFSVGVVVTMLLFVCAAGGVAWVYTGMVAQERWPIRWLQVEGPFERVGAERVRASLTPFVTGSYFKVATEHMRDVAEDMPWVSAVTVQKSWPDTVQVTIHEYMPVAHWVDGQLVAANGEPFSVPAADEMQGLPWLDSPDTQLELVFENWKKFDDVLEGIGQQVERLTLDPRGSWSARLSGGTKVSFGKGDVFKSLDMLVSTWGDLMQGRALPPVSIDLRYTNGFAVLWPQGMDAIAGNYGEKN